MWFLLGSKREFCAHVERGELSPGSVSPNNGSCCDRDPHPEQHGGRKAALKRQSRY